MICPACKTEALALTSDVNGSIEYICPDHGAVTVAAGFTLEDARRLGEIIQTVVIPGASGQDLELLLMLTAALKGER